MSSLGKSGVAQNMAGALHLHVNFVNEARDIIF